MRFTTAWRSASLRMNQRAGGNMESGAARTSRADIWMAEPIHLASSSSAIRGRWSEGRLAIEKSVALATQDAVTISGGRADGSSPGAGGGREPGVAQM